MGAHEEASARRMSGVARFGGGLALTALLACGIGHLSADRAVEIATSRVPGSAATSARQGLARDLVPDSLTAVPPDKQVWAVVLNLGLPVDCVYTPSGEACPAAPGTTLVVLDAISGEILVAHSPAPPTL
jgi:hypothetical protein